MTPSQSSATNPPPPFTVDIPRPGDAEALAAVHVRGWREAYAGLVPDFHWSDEALRRRKAMWEHTLATWTDPQIHQRLRIARDADAGHPFGFVMIGTSRERDAPRPEELQSLYVVSDMYGSGAAQALVAELLGERPAYLWVADPNPRARRFYEKIGFRADGTSKTDPSLEDLREIRMVR